jgi:hypothetical protein
MVWAAAGKAAPSAAQVQASRMVLVMGVFIVVSVFEYCRGVRHC